ITNTLGRFSILPALTLDGIIFHHFIKGSLNGEKFQEFLEGLLKHMNPYLQKSSVLVMDNCLMHHVEGVAELCEER
ncbi:hypothetical protein K439DRAFT_1331137, partial [Ramaria rubella]